MKSYFIKPNVIESLKAVLPKHMTADRQARLLCTAINKTPKIAECTISSVMQCMIDCSAMGLEPDGRRAHLIPYGKTLTLIVDYKGLVELIYRSGAVEFIDAFCVYENELAIDPALADEKHPDGRARFEIEYGANPDVFHKPLLTDEPGAFIGAYAIAHMKGVSKPKFAWMSKAQIDKIRSRSKAANNGPWASDYEEMAKKTTIRRISQTLPMSSEFAD
jgi:recombination protein RecT